MRWQKYSKGDWGYVYLLVTVVIAVIIGKYLFEVG